MSSSTVIAEAGNVLPAALASLKRLGYAVSIGGDGASFEAIATGRKLIAEHPLALLGLAKLLEQRGYTWQPSDSEVADYLALAGENRGTASSERADVWEEQGAVHIKCATSGGDPVELSTDEARAFATRLQEAITKAEAT
jgi:hypothetical protein